MKVLLLALSFQSVSAPDRWFSADKVQHFFMGTFVQSASFGVLRAAKVDKQVALIAASGFSASAAVGKEILDRRARGDVSAKDIAWTLTGAAAVSPILARVR